MTFAQEYDANCRTIGLDRQRVAAWIAHATRSGREAFQGTLSAGQCDVPLVTILEHYSYEEGRTHGARGRVTVAWVCDSWEDVYYALGY